VSISKLIKLYNIVLIPIVLLLFILLYAFIKVGNMYGVYIAALLVALSPFIAYYITKRVAHI